MGPRCADLGSRSTITWRHAVTTLHIEHAITDFRTWRDAFDRFEPQREQAGVRAQRIMRPVDDEAYVVVELDFDDAAQASKFLGFLREVIWAIPANSPALSGAPKGRILESCS